MARRPSPSLTLPLCSRGIITSMMVVPPFSFKSLLTHEGSQHPQHPPIPAAKLVVCWLIGRPLSESLLLLGSFTSTPISPVTSREFLLVLHLFLRTCTPGSLLRTWQAVALPKDPLCV